ncbi:uncharacterized protein LOC133814790 [Humulus lupulus]|uniref:uncharacterized protein LOC133814790 n=1 Tax=Humulus lupulus TaxID=3486 RepID=UPI002B401951|nr:uncharacterized protein LOC133814790 [Humulus lupulus]
MGGNFDLWHEVGERKYIEQQTKPDIVTSTTEVIRKIQQRIAAAQSRQKCYADKRRRSLEFQVGEKVFLWITPMKGVMRFGKKGKLNPSHVLQHEVIQVDKDLTYEEKPVQILDRKNKVLRNKEVPLVKVLWRSQTIEEAMWEREDEMKAKYSNLL